MTPAVRRPRRRAQDLQGLDALLAEATRVELRDTGADVGGGQEGLHRLGLPSRERRYATERGDTTLVGRGR